MGEYKCIYSVGSVKTDYIPREAARDLMYHKQGPLTEYDLDEIEAADVVPVKHGRWREGKKYLECLCCHYIFARLYPKNYCPNCGAKMDGEINE